jgi:hypothetical protein
MTYLLSEPIVQKASQKTMTVIYTPLATPKFPEYPVVRTHGGKCAARSERSQNNLALGVPPAEHCDGKHHFGLIEELRCVLVEAF